MDRLRPLGIKFLEPFGRFSGFARSRTAAGFILSIYEFSGWALLPTETQNEHSGGHSRQAGAGNKRCIDLRGAGHTDKGFHWSLVPEAWQPVFANIGRCQGGGRVQTWDWLAECH